MGIQYGFEDRIARQSRSEYVTSCIDDYKSEYQGKYGWCDKIISLSSEIGIENFDADMLEDYNLALRIDNEDVIDLFKEFGHAWLLKRKEEIPQFEDDAVVSILLGETSKDEETSFLWIGEPPKEGEHGYAEYINLMDRLKKADEARMEVENNDIEKLSFTSLFAEYGYEWFHNKFNNSKFAKKINNDEIIELIIAILLGYKKLDDFLSVYGMNNERYNEAKKAQELYNGYINNKGRQRY